MLLNARGQSAPALALSSFAQTLRDTAGAGTGAPQNPATREEYTRSIEQARQALGAERAAAVWRDGQQLSLTEAIAVAALAEP